MPTPPKEKCASAGTQSETASWRSNVGVAVSRIVLASVLAASYDPLMGMFLGVLCLAGLLGAALCFRSRPVAARKHLIKASIYGMAAVAVLLGYRNLQDNADLLVAKLAAYKQQKGAYPERMDALVPDYLSEISSGGRARFHYTREKDSYFLIYRPSMAGPCSYRPETGAWSCRTP